MKERKLLVALLIVLGFFSQNSAVIYVNQLSEKDVVKLKNVLEKTSSKEILKKGVQLSLSIFGAENGGHSRARTIG